VRQLSATSIEQIQARMQGLGYAVAKVDGKAGMNTRALVGAYQKANNLKIDCWPSEAVLTHMRDAGKPADQVKSIDVKREKSGVGVQSSGLDARAGDGCRAGSRHRLAVRFRGTEDRRRAQSRAGKAMACCTSAWHLAGPIRPFPRRVRARS